MTLGQKSKGYTFGELYPLQQMILGDGPLVLPWNHSPSGDLKIPEANRVTDWKSANLKISDENCPTVITTEAATKF